VERPGALAQVDLTPSNQSVRLARARCWASPLPCCAF